VVPLSANSNRFQYKTTGKGPKETQQDGDRGNNSKASAVTPQPQRRDQRFDRKGPSDNNAPREDWKEDEDTSGFLRPKAPKRRRAQSVIIDGEDPALPSKVMENFVPPPIKPRKRADRVFDSYDSPSPDTARARHFKHLKPMFQPRSPSAWPRRQIGPIKAREFHHDRHRGKETGSGDYAKMMSGPAKRRHNITHGVRRKDMVEDSPSSAAEDEQADAESSSLFLPRSGKFGRKRSHSLIETTPVEGPNEKRKFPLVDMKKIMEEEMDRKTGSFFPAHVANCPLRNLTALSFADIPVSPHIDEQPLSVPSADDQTDLSEMVRFYILGDSIAVEEDREHEFKAVQQTKNPMQAISEHCKKYINAFLNTDGGTMYFGVEDDGRLVGVPLDRKTRDMIRLKIDGIVSRMLDTAAQPRRACLLTFKRSSVQKTTHRSILT
jgi:hypothetical protein